MKISLLINSCLILVGAVSILAFAPFHYFYLVYCTLAILLTSMAYSSPKQALSRNFAFGLGYFGAGASWVYVSVYQYGGLPWLLAILVTLGFIALLAILLAMPGYILQRYWPTMTLSKYLLVFPSLWLLDEWLRSWLFTGFPWLLMGESQTNSPLAGFTPLVGIYGTSWLSVLVAGLLVLIFMQIVNNKAKALVNYKQLTLLALSILIVFTVGGLLKFIQWTKPIGQPIKVALLQGNIPQSLKWDPSMIDLSLTRYSKLTQMNWHNQLIIWPENAIPLALPDAEDFLIPLAHMAKTQQTTILLGLPVPLDEEHYYNSLLAIGQYQGIYYKKHLVPFGEYIPFSQYFKRLLAILNVPMLGFSPGSNHQSALKIGNIAIAPFICYEIAYPHLVRFMLPNANILVTINDDAWFGHSIAGWQHLQIAQMQALASGRPLLFDSNDGVTAVIDEKGHIQSILPRFITANLQDIVQARTGTTPWVYLGDWPFILLALLLIVISRSNHQHKSKALNKD